MSGDGAVRLAGDRGVARHHDAVLDRLELRGRNVAHDEARRPLPEDARRRTRLVLSWFSRCSAGMLSAFMSRAEPRRRP